MFGWFLFLGLTYTDIKFLSEHCSLVDKIIVGCLLMCFQICFILSTVYHTFSCRSAKAYDICLSYDMFGIALSLLAIFISGIYYAFWCQSVRILILFESRTITAIKTFQTLRNFYVISVGIIFVMAMVLQLPRLAVKDNIKMMALLGWAVYGVVPTCHWYFEMGGSENRMVQV